MRSIRRSLLLGAVCGVSAVLVAAGLGVERGVRHALLREMDRALEGEARFLASTVDTDPDAEEMEFTELDMQDFAEPGGPAVLEIRDEEGAVVYRSPSADEGEAPLAAGPTGPADFRFIRSGDGRRMRLFRLSFRPRVDHEYQEQVDRGEAALFEPAPLSLALARETAGLDTLLARVRVLLAVVGVLAAVMVIGVVHVVVQRSLRPLDELAAGIARLGGGRLAERIALGREPAEVTPVVRRLNELLARLEAAFLRERTFSADIAHELRTPLAGLRTAIEVQLSRPREAPAYRAALEDALGIVRRMQDMTQTMLLLGRLEAGQARVEPRAVDLAELARAAWEPFAAVAAARGLDVRQSLPERAVVVTDPVLYDAALRNLFENAVLHADAGGRVRIEVRAGGRDRRPGGATLQVGNSGSRIAPEEVGGLFERFTRGDAARDATQGHSGLGLALVKRIAAALEIALEARSTDGGEFVVALTHPE